MKEEKIRFIEMEKTRSSKSLANPLLREAHVNLAVEEFERIRFIR